MIRKILIGVSLACTLYFFVMAAYAHYRWAHMKDRAWGSVETWKVIELGESKFAIEADFTFSHKGTSYFGTTRLGKPYHYNRTAAEKEIERKKQEKTVVYLDGKHPSRSSLEHFFPLKKILYFVLTVGICVYFLFLERFFFQERVQKA